VLFLVPPIVGIALGLALGGRVENLDALNRLRWSWVLGVGVAVRIVTGFTPAGEQAWAPYAYVASLLMILVWCLAQVDRLPAIWIVVLGLVANLTVILSNAGHMPVEPSTGLVPKHTGGTYVVADAATRFPWLSDWIGTPAWLGGALSPGDVLIAVGLGAVAFAITRFPASPSKLENPQPESESQEGSSPP
jgi:hypothetical protein